MTTYRKCFKCDNSGYIRHWGIAGTKAAQYTGEISGENQLRLEIDKTEVAIPPDGIALNASGPFGGSWRYYDPGQNIFVEQSGFYQQLSILDMYGATHVEVDEDIELPIRFWACGTADLWVNDGHVCRHSVPKYMYPEPTIITVPLKRGRNCLVVRVLALGTRDTRFLFGMQVLENAEKVEVWLPAPDEITKKLVEIEEWIQNVKVSGRDTLCSDNPAPISASIGLRGGAIDWPMGADSVTFDPTGQSSPSLSVKFEGQQLSRKFDIPTNRSLVISTADSIEEHRRNVLSHMVETGRGVRGVLARHTLDERAEGDEKTIFDALDKIDERPDCADFDLAAIIRLYMGSSFTEKERKRTKETILAFRYWSDEPGTDAMCFGSENHSLLFHGCQLIAGQFFPDEIFSNSGRKGQEQAKIGKERCLKWLDQVEKHGFKEFLSSTYMPLTAAALLNVMDFSGDDGMAKRAASLVDDIFRDLAMHSYDGVTVGPQGRVYRGVLFPDSSGTQAMVSYASKEAVIAYNDWLSFVAASQNYRIPDDIDALMKESASKLYRQANVEIQIEKTADYLLTSLQIPASYKKTREAAPPQSWKGMYPGMRGYQQHIWHATLGRDCHIFVNHPGASFDLSSSRPGFWYGNGFVPRTNQDKNMVLQIFDTPESHPIHFTHAYWPIDTFDKQEIRDQWAFGVKGTGYVALWCSNPLKLHSDMLTDHELRAEGLRAGWICVCSGVREYESFELFIRSCLEMKPRFDEENLALYFEGQVRLLYEPC